MVKKRIFILLVISIFFILLQHCLCTQHAKNIAREIVTIFQEHMLTYDIDRKSIDEKYSVPNCIRKNNEYDILLKKLTHFIQSQQPIILTMIGFPYKSVNTNEKVISSTADAAERYSLLYLQRFLDKIKKIYPLGIKLRIFTDGIIFGDLERVSDSAIVLYESILKKISYDLPDIQFYTMHDLCLHQSAEEIRATITKLPPSFDLFCDMLEKDSKLQEDKALLIQRLAFELSSLSLDQEEIEAIALQEIHRGFQYSNFLKQFRPDETIACSVHYQKSLDKKIGLKLSDVSYITPWHGVLVERNGHFSIEYLKDIDHSLYHIKEWNINDVLLAYVELIGSQ